MPANGTIRIEWYGQSMFRIQGGGVTLVVDPTNPQTGYDYNPVQADAVLITHDHFDHNFMDGVLNRPEVLNKPGEREAAELRVHGFSAFHDNAGGRERGSIVIFAWEQAGFTLAHLGDLGERPSPGALEALKGRDILMVPVGGVFTIDGKQAVALISEIKPRIVIPMHFKTPDCVVGIEPLQNFIRYYEGEVRDVGERPLSITRDDLPEETEVWVLPYKIS